MRPAARLERLTRTVAWSLAVAVLVVAWLW